MYSVCMHASMCANTVNAVFSTGMFNSDSRTGAATAGCISNYQPSSKIK